MDNAAASKPAASSASAAPVPRAAALAAVLAFVSFLPTLAAGFVYDDTLLISQNPAVQRWSAVTGAFTRHFWETQDLGSAGVGLTYYRPLVTLSFALNWLAFNGAAWGFHLVNIVLHAGVVWLATRMALRWLERPWLAVLVGVLFAVHPTRNESVVWIAGRTDLLMSLFALGAVELLHEGRRTQRQLYDWLGLAAFLATLLCKEGAVALPLLLLADALRDEPKLSRPSRTPLLIAATIAVGYALLRATVYPVRNAHSELLPAYGFMTVATYVERLFWPFPQTFFFRNLTGTMTEGIDYPWGLVACGLALSLGWVALLVVLWRRQRAAAACLVAGTALLAPVLNFFETGIYVSVSDHFLYLPLFLVLLAVAAGFRGVFERISDRALGVATLVVAVACFFPNLARAKTFKNDFTSWTHELKLNPNNPVALEALSVEQAGRGNLEEALALLRRADGRAARRFFLLSGPGAVSGRHVREVELTAALTPDGDARALELFYEELAGYYRGVPSTHRGNARGVEVGRNLGQARIAQRLNQWGRDQLAAELATLATRLGKLEAARKWLHGIDPESYRLLPNRINLVLAFARAGEHGEALTVLERLDEARSEHDDRAVLERLAHRLGVAKSLEEQAQLATRGEKDVLRARAALELASYLVACRHLRKSHLASPDDQQLAQLYTQALVSARLDAEARRVAGRFLPPEQVQSVVNALTQKQPKAMLALAPAPDGDQWWQAE